MGTVKTVINSQRQVVTVPLQCWHTFQERIKGGDKTQPVTLAQCRKQLIACNADMIGQFAQFATDNNAQLVTVVVQAGEALYTPPGWITVEKIGCAGVTGVRRQLIGKSCSAAYLVLQT